MNSTTPDHKRAEAANRNLAHAQRLAVMGEFTAMIAHEVNQPLGAILSNADAAEILLESAQPRLDEVRQILADIRKDALRASEVVRRMRTLMCKREPEMQPVDLNQAISEVLALIAGDMQRRHIPVATHLAPQLPCVEGDKAQLQQVLFNLMLNGMDSMAETPVSQRQLSVSTSRPQEKSVEIAVSDSGHGIAPDRLKRLFESFYTTKKEGMGLGLSIARSIIEAHQGRIWAENNAGGGAAFRFRLPIGMAGLTSTKGQAQGPNLDK